MVKDITNFTADQIAIALPFLTKVAGNAIRSNDGQIFRNIPGQEKESLSINDIDGQAIYIRQLQSKNVTEGKRLGSKTKNYEIIAPCRLVFYSFNTAKPLDGDKIESLIVTTLRNINFNTLVSIATEVDLTLKKISTNLELLFKEETGKDYSGGTFPILIGVDFDLKYNSINCDPCDHELDAC